MLMNVLTEHSVSPRQTILALSKWSARGSGSRICWCLHPTRATACLGRVTASSAHRGSTSRIFLIFCCFYSVLTCSGILNIITFFFLMLDIFRLISSLASVFSAIFSFIFSASSTFSHTIFIPFLFFASSKLLDDAPPLLLLLASPLLLHLFPSSTVL